MSDETQEMPEKRGPGRPRKEPDTPVVPANVADRPIVMTVAELEALVERKVGEKLAASRTTDPVPAEPKRDSFDYERIEREVLSVPDRPFMKWIIGPDDWECSRMIQLFQDRKAPVGLGEIDLGKRTADVTMEFTPAPAFIQAAFPKHHVCRCDISALSGIVNRVEDLATLPAGRGVKGGDYTIDQAVYAYYEKEPKFLRGILSDAEFKVEIGKAAKIIRDKKREESEHESAILQARESDVKSGRAFVQRVQAQARNGVDPIMPRTMAGAGVASVPIHEEDNSDIM